MSADLLRQAATILRERAAQATPGPWHFKATEALGDGSVFGDVMALNGRVGDSDDEGGAFFITDGMYIATMHPGVGRALADLLDASADRLDERGPTFMLTKPEAKMLDLARLIVGGDA